MDFFSILLTYRCTTLGLTVSCLWWQQAHCTESVAKKYLSTWKAERNQLKRMPITSDISANNKEIFIYEMIVWAVMVWLDCPFRQLMLQKGHDYPALFKKANYMTSIFVIVFIISLTSLDVKDFLDVKFTLCLSVFIYIYIYLPFSLFISLSLMFLKIQYLNLI